METRSPESVIAVEELKESKDKRLRARREDRRIARSRRISVNQLDVERGYNEMTKALSLMGQSSIGT